MSSWFCYDDTIRIAPTTIPSAQCPDALQTNALLSLVGRMGCGTVRVVFIQFDELSIVSLHILLTVHIINSFVK